MPSTPTQQSSLAEVEQWLRWFLSENTKLSPKRQAALASKLACSGKTLLSYTETQLLRKSPDFGDMIFNALHGMKIALRMHRHIDLSSFATDMAARLFRSPTVKAAASDRHEYAEQHQRPSY